MFTCNCEVLPGQIGLTAVVLVITGVVLDTMAEVAVFTQPLPSVPVTV
jgi:hypothetical protein